MPSRVARSTVQASTNKKSTGQRHRKRQLDAYAIAGKLAPEKSAIRSHRLGVAEDDEPKSKRPRVAESDDDELSETEQSHRKVKRARQDEDHDVDFGSDSEGNEWVAGGMMNDDDDESIDSDEAFGESDEERFDGFTFRGSSSKKSTSKARNPVRQQGKIGDEIDLDEEQSSNGEDGDSFGEEGVDLATMLDNEASEEDSASGDDGESEVSSGDAYPSDDSATDEEDLQEQDPERHARLQDFVEGLDKPGVITTEPRRTAHKITIDDLLEDADLDNKTLATLRPNKKSREPEMVKPLLPKRQQDTFNREAASKKAKQQLDRWRDTVIHNRRAEFLSFPLKHSDEAGPMAKDIFAPTQQNAPVTDLEANIQKIMQESGMVSRAADQKLENDLLEAEGLAIKDMPVEEVLRRRAELRRNRDLLFREEMKAKRISKIKSKSYRRVHRKERERMADKERMLMDPEGFARGELAEDEQDLADRRRAEARMSVKHKNSKWAKTMRAQNRAAWDAEARDGPVDMARRQEELKLRIAGKAVHDQDADSASASDDQDDEQDIAKRVAMLRAEEPAATGVAGMKFMLAANARRKAQNAEALAELEGDAEPEEIEDEGLGRAIFGPRPTANKQESVQKQPRPELEEGDLSEEEVLADEPAIPARTSNATSSVKSGVKSSTKTASKGSGPLAATKPSADKPDLQLNQPSKPEDVSVWLSAPREKKGKLDRKLARQDEEAIISTDLSSLPKTSNKDQVMIKDTPVHNTNGWTEFQIDADDADVEQETPMLTRAEQNAAFHARAFAGDDVALQFDAEKEELMASEDEKEVNNSMPGWGSWAGAGLSKAVRKAAARARHNPLYKTKVPGTRPQDRKDAKLENVIISEKVDRKGKKYLAPMLPHQFERKTEYERSLRMPIGPEWSTKEVLERNTRPRVIVKPGTIIEPISRPLM